MQEVLTGNGRTALFLALAALAFPTRALDLGEVEVLSALGQRLDARIPLHASAGEWFHVTCLALAPPAAGAILPGLASGTLSVERRQGAANLRLRSAEPVNDPVLAFALTSTCAGSPQPVGRELSILLDPPGLPRARPAPEATRAARAEAPSPAPRRTRATGTAPMPVPVRMRDAGEPRRAETPAPVLPTKPPASPEFVLKLTSAPIDVARTRQFDDKARALLRERLRLLDNDDQVAAMLSMRDNLRRLETRVAELQLKLAAMPDTLARVTPPPADPVPASATLKVEPPVLKAEPPPVKVEPAAVKTEPPPVKSEPATPKVIPVAPKADAARKPPAAPKAAEPAGDFLSGLPGGIALWAAALIALLALIAAWAWKRRARAAEEARDQREHWQDDSTVMMPAAEAQIPRPASALDDEQPIEVAAPVRPQIATDAALATSPREDTEALRRRYIEERFPEIRNGAIALDDPASVVKGARLFYEDGAIPKAVELLRFAIEDRPDQVRPWLALFEIYRLERLSGEYAQLAGRFRERHGASAQWAMARALGREVDPSNPVYQEPPMRSLETIGPREARQMAAASVDPIVENWLEAPMDFENEVLATELRRSLMTRASVDESDLAPNPMPALRSVEMFSVG